MKALFFIILTTVTLSSVAQIDYRLAYDLFKQTNYLDATKEFKKHLKVDPKDSKALYHIGLCYLNTNVDIAAAFTYLKKCLDTEKADKECLFYLGQAYSHMYEYDLAIEKFKRQVELAPDNANSYDSLGDGFRAAGMLLEALASYKKAVEINPEFEASINNIEEVEEELKK